MTQSAHAIRSEVLQGFVARSFAATGMPKADADIAAGLMTQADLMGQDGHGVFRLPMYINRIRASGLNVAPKFRRLQDRTARASVDGDNGLGPLVMHHATQLAMEKQKRPALPG